MPNYSLQYPFKEEEIIAEYRRQDFLALKESGVPICAYIYNIRSSEKDLAILESWKDWFTKKRVPWVVTCHQNGDNHFPYLLWKEDQSLTVPERKRLECKEVKTEKLL